MKSTGLSPKFQVCKKQNRIIKSDVYHSRSDKAQNVVFDGMSTTGDGLNVFPPCVHYEKTFSNTVEYPICNEFISGVEHASDREQHKLKTGVDHKHGATSPNVVFHTWATGDGSNAIAQKIQEKTFNLRVTKRPTNSFCAKS